MADIFISYASADREIARTLGQALSARGHDTWWDRTIPTGRVFDEVIQEALAAARCVIVLWSPSSVASNWVKTEAAEAAARNILLPVMVGTVPAPIEFKRIQSANLAAWNGDADDPEFANLLASVDRLLAGAAKPAATAAVKGATSPGWGQPPGRPAGSGLRKWSLIAAATLLILGAGAMWVYRLGVNAGRTPAAAQSAPSSAVASAREAAEVPAQKPAPPARPVAGKLVNLILAENGGHLVAASSDAWAQTINGKEHDSASLNVGDSGVYAFKDERPARFDTFTMLIHGSADRNIKRFELFKGNDSPTGKFESIGSFETQNVKLFATPYQAFKFPAVTAKYFKLKIVSLWSDTSTAFVFQFQLLDSGT